MNKKFVPFLVILAVAVIVGVALMPSTPAATKHLIKKIETSALENKIVFLQLSSSGCVTCRKMKPEVEKIAENYKNSGDVSIINIDVDSHPSIAAQYKISSVPTQIILSTKSIEMFRHSGYLSFNDMRNLINQMINK